MIPNQLKKEEFRFVLLKEKDKIPFEKDWQTTTNYKFNDQKLIDHIKSGGNYGCIGGFGKLLIIDFDDKVFEKEVKPLLPETMTVLTGSGGTHLYYFCENTTSFKVLDQEKNTLADIQGKGKQVVAPGCTHPNGNKYQVLNDSEIKKISYNNLQLVFSKYMKKNKVKNQNKLTEDRIVEQIKREIGISSVMNEYGYDNSRNPTMCQLGHGSKGGACFSWNNELWNCFHCDEGGDVFNFVMKHDNCEFVEAKRKLMQIGGIEEVKVEPGNKIDDIKNEVITQLLLKKRNTATEIIRDYIINNNHIYTTRDDEKSEMWIYQNGIYRPNGKTFIKEMCREILDAGYTTTLCNSVIAKVEVDTFIEQEDLFINENVDLVPVQNGILNLRRRELMEFSPKYRFFNKLPSTYNKSKDCPMIKNFFRSILRSEEDYIVMQELFGYLLYRDYKIEKAFMMLGNGRNGKGKTIELMKRFLGSDNTSNIPLQTIETNDFAMSELFNKMANLSADISKTALKETGKFKSLTGHDLISAPRKFLKNVNFVNYAKMIFCANDLPMTYDTSDGFFDRWVMIDFIYKFLSQKEIDILNTQEKVNPERIKQADTEMIDKISTQEELDGLLNWALDGLDRLMENNDFSTSTSGIEVKNKWLRKSSSILAFIMDCVEVKDDSKVPKAEFRTEYAKYCRKHKISPVTEKFMANALAINLGVGEERIAFGNERLRCWVGIILKKTSKNGEKTESLKNPCPDVHPVHGFSPLGKNLKNCYSPKNGGLPGHPGHHYQTGVEKTDDLNLKHQDILFHLDKFGKNGIISIQQLIEDLGKEAEPLIEKMQKDGILHQPRSGFIKKL
tara:strand:+ start:5560 stop:8082 length:2523 start_codon:yes stop_codon:yes gene_type:complete